MKVWEFEIGVGVAANTEEEARDKLIPALELLEKIDYEGEAVVVDCGVMDETKEDND